MTSYLEDVPQMQPGIHATSAQVARRPYVVIQPSSGWSALGLRELWEYRDLLGVLAGRDVRLRYKQTVLGVIWVVLQPLVAALIFAVVFGRFAHLPSDGSPYVLFVFCGVLPWNLFSGVLTRAGNSLIGDSRLISKVYFPRMLIPLASSGAVLVDFTVSLLVLAILLPIYHTGPGWQIVTIPFWLLLTLLGGCGVALWFSALNVRYRDFTYALPFVIQVWMFATPVAYAGTLVPGGWRAFYALNPAFGYIEGFRWAILGRSSISLLTLSVTVAVSIGMFISGAFFFRRIERGFADVV